MICHKSFYISDPSSIIALPFHSVSPSLLSLNFVPMGLVDLVGPVSLVDLLSVGHGESAWLVGSIWYGVPSWASSRYFFCYLI